MEQDYSDRIYNIFADFFGEEFVDLQAADNTKWILIHFPEVTVTNENDNSINIQDLFVRVAFYPNIGILLGDFEMKRTTYPLSQLNSGYCHSHVSNIFDGGYAYWKSPCLGNGPLNATVSSLHCTFNEDIWNLFCLELAKYVTVESLKGVPYMYLEKIGNTDNSIKIPTVFEKKAPLFYVFQGMMKDFLEAISYKRPFKFNFMNGCYGLAMSNTKALTVLSNEFIKWYNELPKKEQDEIGNPMTNGILLPAKMIGNDLYYINGRVNAHTAMQDNNVQIVFKGKEYRLKVIDDLEEDDNISYLFNLQFFTELLDLLLNTLNYKNGYADESGEITRYL